MITTMLPLMVVLAAGIFLGERITVRVLTGFLVAVAGGLWLSLAGKGSEQSPQPLLGNFLEFMAMVCATGYTILMKHLSKELHPIFLTGLQAFSGTIFFLPILLLPRVEVAAAFSVSGVLTIVYLGVVVSVCAYGLYNYAVSKIPASQAAAFVNLIPVFSILLGFILLDERLSLWQIAACSLVFAGVYISQKRRGISLHEAAP